MRRQISIAELQHAGLTFRAVEAVAVVRQLILPSVRVASGEPGSALGPPSPENVFVERDGAVSCPGCEATPAVSELAIFLQRLLPAGTPGVPGSLRYTLARALLDVDAPPFDSIDQFSAALERHAAGDAKAIVRGLLGRVAHGETDLSRRVERRRTAPGVSDLRRQLRAADARVYEQQLALDALAAMTAKPRTHTPSRLAITVAAAGALLLFGAAEARHLRRQAPPIVVAAAPPDLAPASTDIVPAGTSGHVAGGPVNLEPAASNTQSRQLPRSDRRGAVHVRRASPPRLLDRLHLRWLHRKVAIRSDAP